MQVSLRTYRLPGWLVPLLVLAALALVPFALALALGLLVLVSGGAVLGRLLGMGRREIRSSGPSPDPTLSNSTVIDADYEVKHEPEKH